MGYTSAREDIKFVLNELADLPEVLAGSGFENLSVDLVESVIEEAAKFAERVLAPINRAADIAPPRLADGVVTTSAGYKQAYADFAACGWQELQHGTEWGTRGLPKLVAAATCENFNAANLAFSLCPLLTDGVIEALSRAGSKKLQDLFLPALLRGRWTGTMNLTEPQAGSDLSLISTRALRQADGNYRLFGQKIFITYGEHDLAENIVHLVLARIPDAPAGIKGLSLFVVPKFLINSDGTLGARNDVWCASIEHKLGIHGSPTAVLLYGSGKTSEAGGALGYLVGQENRGLEYMFIMMNAARFSVGLQGVAVSQRALEQADAYAGERRQGQDLERPNGAVSINRHPDVQRMLLIMRALTEGNRALAYVAASALDQSQSKPNYGDDARFGSLYEYLVPIIKGYATECAVEVTSLSMQVHAGLGYIEESGVAQLYRDARILPIYEGTTAIQANDLVVRKVIRDGGATVQWLALKMRHTLDEIHHAASHGEASARDAFRVMGFHLLNAIEAYEAATAYLLSKVHSAPRAAFAGSVPYLMLSGVTLAGWQMARAMLACQNRQAVYSAQFRQQKLATGVASAVYLLPRSQANLASIMDGEVMQMYVKNTEAG